MTKRSRLANKDSCEYRYAASLADKGYSLSGTYEAIAATLLAMARCPHKNMREGIDYHDPVEGVVGAYTAHNRLWCADCGFDTAYAWKYSQLWLLSEPLVKDLVRRGIGKIEVLRKFNGMVAVKEGEGEGDKA